MLLMHTGQCGTAAAAGFEHSCDISSPNGYLLKAMISAESIMRSSAQSMTAHVMVTMHML